MSEIDRADDAEDALGLGHANQIRSAQPRFAKLIGETTGWRGVDNLADFVIELLIANQGRSGLDYVRPPCWQEHKPQTVTEFRAAIMQASGLPEDHPFVVAEVATYCKVLKEMFGLS